MSKTSAWVFEVSEADFEEKVIKKSHDVPVVVDFWAPWCAPCRALGPILEGMIEKREGAVLLAKVNTDDEQNLALNYNVGGIPYVVGFRKGRPMLEFTGLLPEAQIADFLDRLRPSEAEKRIEAAAGLEKTDPAEAERLYRAALKNDPQAEDAIVGLARVLVEAKKEQEATDLLEPIGPGSEFSGEADRLRAILWLQGQAKELPAEDALRQKAKAEPKNAQALCDLGCVLAAHAQYAESLEVLLRAGLLDRKLASTRVRETMVKIFFVVGVRSELADVYRDKLTGLLY